MVVFIIAATWDKMDSTFVALLAVLEHFWSECCSGYTPLTHSLMRKVTGQEVRARLTASESPVYNFVTTESGE
jgi:hypothetical protein